MITGWGFDTPLAGHVLPSKLTSPVDEFDLGPNLKISSDRSGDADKWVFDNPFIIAANMKIVKSPFAAGKALQVVQGYCNALISHNGDTAAFCYDLSKPNEP